MRQAGSRRFRAAFLLLIPVLLIVCSCGFLTRSRTPLNSPEALYDRAVWYYHKEDYKKAIELFQRIKEEHPLSKLALMAELGIADSYFSDGLFVEAEMNYTEFINLHPTNPNVPYAIYQLGMCHYKQMSSIDRDQTETMKAKKEFERLIFQFPASRFAALAQQKLRECKKRLAEHEFYVGHFYFKMKQYKAALKRFELIEKEYPNLGLDYKVAYFLAETRRRIEVEERERLAREREEKEKETLKNQKKTDSKGKDKKKG